MSARSLLLGAALLGLLGCGQKKVAECNALTGVINSGVIALEKAPRTDSAPAGVADLRSTADLLDKTATEAAALQLTVTELKKSRDEYLKMMKEIARLEREVAAAAEAKDRARTQKAQGSLEGAVKGEDPLVDQINKFCQGP